MLLLCICWWNQPQILISPTFYKKVFSAAFLYLQFGFVVFWQYNIVAKACYKMFYILLSAFLKHFENLLPAYNLGLYFWRKEISQNLHVKCNEIGCIRLNLIPKRFSSGSKFQLKKFETTFWREKRTKSHVTRDIFAHNIEIKKTFLGHRSL